MEVPLCLEKTCLDCLLIAVIPPCENPRREHRCSECILRRRIAVHRVAGRIRHKHEQSLCWRAIGGMGPLANDLTDLARVNISAPCPCKESLHYGPSGDPVILDSDLHFICHNRVIGNGPEAKSDTQCPRLPRRAGAARLSGCSPLHSPIVCATSRWTARDFLCIRIADVIVESDNVIAESLRGVAMKIGASSVSPGGTTQRTDRSTNCLGVLSRCFDVIAADKPYDYASRRAKFAGGLKNLSPPPIKVLNRSER